MGIIFLHISDSHFIDNNFSTPTKINKMVSSIATHSKFSTCIIIYSGDIANSGSSIEYTYSDIFLERLIRELQMRFQNVKIKVVVVPGNHDVYFSDLSRDRNEVLGIVNSLSTNKLIAELELLNNFFVFAKKNDCYKSDNKIVDVQYFDFDNHSIRFNLINSAIFSTLKDSSDDNDNGLHFLRQEDIDILMEGNDVDLEITIMHHPFSLYQPKVSKKLTEVLYKFSSILFLGHDHSYNTTMSKRKSELLICDGGALNDASGRSLFSTLAVDMNNGKSVYISHTWDETNMIYERTTKEESTIILRKRLNSGLKPNREFLSEFQNDLLFNFKSENGFLDYFVYPRLVYLTEEKYEINDNIISEQDFNEITQKSKICHIEGPDFSGKTSFLKYLYIQSKQINVPLFFNFGTMDKAKIKYIVKNTFKEQYLDDSAAYDAYLQLPKEKRIAFIDDTDKCNSQELESFLLEYKDFFHQFFFISSTKMSIDFKEKFKHVVQSGTDVVRRFKILPFLSNKREQLIDYIVKNNKEVPIFEREQKISLINNTIKDQLNIFSSYPYFIIMYTVYTVSPYAITSEESKNVFNAMFQANITRSLHNDHLKEDIVLFVLQKIAYFIHFSRFNGMKKHPLPYVDFINIIDDYNRVYEKEINHIVFKEILCNSRIINVDINGNLFFTSKNYLSYFIAKALNDSIPSEKGWDDLKKITDNLCFGINAEILLFLCFLTGKVAILDHVLTEANLLMSDWEEADLDKQNIKCIQASSKIINIIKLPTEEDKHRHKENQEKQESEISYREELQSISYYDYDENSINTFISIQQKSIKFIEIIAKSLPNFEHRLETERKRKFVNAIYTYPNKLIKFILSPIDEGYDNLVEEAKNLFMHNDKELDENQVREIIFNIATTFLLNLYDFTARTSTDTGTIKALEKFDYSSNSNYRLLNLMIHENYDNNASFLVRAEGMFDDNNNKYIRNLIRRVVHKRFLNTSIEYKDKAQYYANKFFGSDGNSIIKESRRNILFKK